ncbi:hypothetical protein [Pararobbsia alpina]|uniref:Uncharacterized protein n=1 Tax=Pararobbsia alpina TaxID=621374 RepID=A0A6S7DG89_9BURK|nr:hypothetical protein [Pararobbsia alpina]CAB3804943.1 hypothetical protein LMG28138_05602 [Pararobbsia alpina]
MLIASSIRPKTEYNLTFQLVRPDGQVESMEALFEDKHLQSRIVVLGAYWRTTAASNCTFIAALSQ